jgi:hypothetical protein
MLKVQERKAPRGIVTIRTHKAGTLTLAQPLADEARFFAQLISQPNVSAEHRDHYKVQRDDCVARMKAILKRGEIGEPIVQKNMIMFSLNYGFDIIVQYLISDYNGSFAFPLGIAWGEIGTGQTSPSNLDIALTTPTNRATVSYAADSAFNEAQLQFFFPDSSLANQTYYEFGTFIGGNSGIGTGNIFNHALFTTPYSKSAGTDTTVEVDFQFGSDSGFDDTGFS